MIRLAQIRVVMTWVAMTRVAINKLRRWWPWLRLFVGAVILAMLVRRLSAGAFLTGVREVDGWSLLAAAAIAALTTVCCAWRWTIIASGLGVGLPLRSAVAAYYRSQFLNTVLPGGVLGDVHRAVRHGREVGDLGRGLRAVTWERAAGQVAQAVIAVIVLSALPSPVRSWMPTILLSVAGCVLLGVLGVRMSPHGGPSRWARTRRAARADLRDGLLARRAWPGIVVACVVVVAGHVGTFLIAAHAAGVTASPQRILPLALLAMLAMGVPTNIGGWGPREGMAAWAFGTAGMGADRGLATAVVYGILALAATLPGAGVLVLTWWHRDRVPQSRPVLVGVHGAARG